MQKVSTRRWVLVLISAALQLVPFPIAGPVPLWRRVFCWFCLAPLLVALLGEWPGAKRPSPRQCALLGYVCGIAWYLGNCYWIYQTMYLYGGLAKPVAFGILLLFCFYLGLYHALFGWLTGYMREKAGARWALVASTFFWVAVELARARVTGFPWDLLGYTQVDNQALTALAPLGGVMMLSFVITSVNVLFATAWLVKSNALQWKIAGIGLASTIALQAGCAYQAPQDPAEHMATLLQENLAVGTVGKSIKPLGIAEKYREFISLSKNPTIAAEDSDSEISWPPLPAGISQDFIVWPEAPADFATSDSVFLGEVSGLAESSETTVVAGAVGVDFDAAGEDGYHEFGSAAVFDRYGKFLGRYDKIHRVPWGEYVPYKSLFFFAGKLVSGVGRMEAGTRHSIFSANGHRFGIFICYESIFGDEVRQFTKDGAQVLINISDDGWYGDTGAPWQHLDMERMRAIENRRWVLRDTNTGVTTVVDPHGRGIFTTPRHVRAAFAFPFDYRSDVTLYSRHGDWFAWLCAVTAALLFAGATMGWLPKRHEVHLNHD